MWKSCTRSADTICAPQEEFHCIEPNKGSCELAVEHSKCKPGQYINQTGECLYILNCRCFKTIMQIILFSTLLIVQAFFPVLNNDSIMR